MRISITRVRLIKWVCIALFIVVVLLLLLTLNIFAYHVVSGSIIAFPW